MVEGNHLCSVLSHPVKCSTTTGLALITTLSRATVPVSLLAAESRLRQCKLATLCIPPLPSDRIGYWVLILDFVSPLRTHTYMNIHTHMHTAGTLDSGSMRISTTDQVTSAPHSITSVWLVARTLSALEWRHGASYNILILDQEFHNQLDHHVSICTTVH